MLVERFALGNGKGDMLRRKHDMLPAFEAGHPVARAGNSLFPQTVLDLTDDAAPKQQNADDEDGTDHHLHRQP